MKKTLLLLALLMAGMSSYAQNALGIFSGKVLDGVNNNEPMLGVTVVVKNESTGFQTGITTDNKGHFILEDLPLGGPYTISFSFMGYAPRIYKDYRLNMSDHVVIPSVTLTEDVTTLDEVVVSSFSYKSSRDRTGSSTKIDADVMAKLPSPTRNYKAFAELSPLTKGSSIAGSKPNMMGLTLDGVSNRMSTFGDAGEGAFPISMEAIREFEVITNTYGVADGRGGAGSIKAVTKSGSNDFHATAWGYYTGGSLAGVTVVKDDDTYKKGKKGENSVTQWGLSLSGPIIKNKLHYFVTYDRYIENKPWRTWDFETGGATLEDAENNMGITKKNLDLLVTNLETNYGVPKVQQYGSKQVQRTTENLLGRIDWTINEKHLLMARFSYHLYLQPDKIPSNGLFSAQYKGYSRDNNYLLNLKSRFNHKLRNDLKLSLVDFLRTGNNVYPRVPVGIVNVKSDLPNGQQKDKLVIFGNQFWAPETISSKDIQLVDNLTYVKGNTKWLFGVDVQLNKTKDLLTHNQQGEFIYYSMNNFLNNSPDEFNRKIPITPEATHFVKPNIITSGLYSEATFSPLKNIEVSMGLRWDVTYIPTKPKADPLLVSELGLKSDVAPLDLDNLQPRIFASWDVNGKGTDIIKAGAGLFVSEITTQALSFALINNAGNFKSVSARKVDGNMPPSNWPSYYENFNNVPGYDNWLKTSNINLDEIPNAVHMLDKNLQAPMTFKTNISYTKYLSDKLMLTGGFYYNRTTDNYMLENMNMKETPEFTVKEEGGRGIYVKPELINPKGFADYYNARKSSRFNEVLMFTNASWANTSWNAVLEGAYKIKDGEIRGSYTYGQSKGGVNYNAGNPRDMFYTGTTYNSYKTNAPNWYDNDDMKHKVVLTFISPSYKGFVFSANSILTQSNRFSSYVNLDQNGDKNQNSDNVDLSYIFDPVTAPSYMKEDLQYVYEHTSKEYRKFLDKNKGTFAAYNDGLNPWRAKLNMSLIKSVNLPKKQQIEFRIDLFNALNLFNYKWGGYSYVSNTNLYQIKSFDANTKTYNYSVDKNAGKLRYQVSDGELFRLQFGVKYLF